MVTGLVSANVEAFVRLQVSGPAGQQQVDGIIDTGYTGSLSLPSPQVAMLGLRWICRDEGILADGSVAFFDVYEATVMWDGHARTVETEAIGTHPLIGMDMLRGHDLQIRVLPGGQVSIVPVP